MRKVITYSFLTVIAALALYLLFYPVPIEPAGFEAPANPGITGSFEKNNTLSTAELLLQDIGVGPEDITLGPDSLFYTGFADGRIISFIQEGQLVKTLANTGGRPLGMEFNAAGNLIVADEYKGLISVSMEGEITVLADSVGGKKIFFADDVTVGQDGIIWFSDATQRFHADEILQEFWELQATGRLLSYDLKTKESKVELDGLRFANGVTFGPNEDYILVNETAGLKINKVWLKGSNKGKHEILPWPLPGFPDNISYNGNGIFWVALPGMRISELEIFYNKPFLRKVIARFPQSWIYSETEAPTYGMVIGLDTLGAVVYNLQDSTGNYHSITSVNEYDGYLYLGSNVVGNIARYKMNP